MIYTWVNKVIRQNMRKRVEEIFAFSEAPVETQAELLRGLVSKAQNTTYGQLHHFEHISDREVFSKLVRTNFEKTSRSLMCSKWCNCP